MTPSAEDQLQFLHKIQLLLEEGSFSSTYKYSLLLALADLAVEYGGNDDSSLTIPIKDLAKKFILYYWRQSMPYPSYDGANDVLKQNTGRQVAVISRIIQEQTTHHKLPQALQNTTLVNDIAGVVNEMPLWRLQNLPHGVDDFIYEQVGEGSDIILRAGVAYCFRVFHSQITNMVQGAWVRWVRALNHNNPILGQYTDLNDFMFGSERSSLNEYVPLLKQIQSNSCFYCGESLRGKSDVDHFIPWSRYPVDLGHNFVLAHSTCNREKRDMLSAVEHLEHWVERNEMYNPVMLEYFDDHQLMHNFSTSLSITQWAYEKTESMRGDVWLGKTGVTCKLDSSWRDIFN